MKAQKKLDRTRPYGEIHPAGSHHGAFYEQDGFHFDNDGKLIEELLNDELRAKLTKPAAKKVSGVLSEEQIALLEKSGKLTAEQKAALIAPPKDAKDADPGEGLNLEAWLRGEGEDYDFRDVQTAVKARYSKWCTKKNDLVRFLVLDADGPKVIPPGLVGDGLKGLLTFEAA